jgi:hypothetical protein
MSSGRPFCPLLTAHCLLFCFLGRVTRGPNLALSTFYRTHRGYGRFFVTRDGREVLLLN